MSCIRPNKRRVFDIQISGKKRDIMFGKYGGIIFLVFIRKRDKEGKLRFEQDFGYVQDNNKGKKLLLYSDGIIVFRFGK